MATVILDGNYRCSLTLKAFIIVPTNSEAIATGLIEDPLWGELHKISGNFSLRAVDICIGIND
ncbi:MAG: hypothetical protein EA409_09285 [Saprospirales bacterium]|nr:MAG: hypothetical protein EA409_09285 [Saprospirales bacterium]